MIHTLSLGRAARYYPERMALASGGTRSTFRELHDRVASIAAAGIVNLMLTKCEIIQ